MNDVTESTNAQTRNDERVMRLKIRIMTGIGADELFHLKGEPLIELFNWCVQRDNGYGVVSSYADVASDTEDTIQDANQEALEAATAELWAAIFGSDVTPPNKYVEPMMPPVVEKTDGFGGIFSHLKNRDK